VTIAENVLENCELILPIKLQVFVVTRNTESVLYERIFRTVTRNGQILYGNEIPWKVDKWQFLVEIDQ
jgi:hypothetical protein